MKYLVTASSMNRKTRTKTGGPRVEEVCTKTNELFKRCETAADVEAAYEAFWNELDPRSEDIVKVLDVSPVTETQQVLSDKEQAAVTALTNRAVLRVYSGRPGCACGCRGKYSDSSRSIKIISGRMLKLINAREHDGICMSDDLIGFDTADGKHSYTAYFTQK